MPTDLGPRTQEQQILAIPVNEETEEAFCIDTCSTCDETIDAPFAFVWGEPRGGMVTLHVYDKQECVEERIRSYADEIGKDIILVWKSMPGAEIAFT